MVAPVRIKTIQLKVRLHSYRKLFTFVKYFFLLVLNKFVIN